MSTVDVAENRPTNTIAPSPRNRPLHENPVLNAQKPTLEVVQHDQAVDGIQYLQDINDFLN
jgi:hypothetical protein